MLLLAVLQSMKHEAWQETPYTRYRKLSASKDPIQSRLRNLQSRVFPILRHLVYEFCRFPLPLVLLFNKHCIKPTHFLNLNGSGSITIVNIK